MYGHPLLYGEDRTRATEKDPLELGVTLLYGGERSEENDPFAIGFPLGLLPCGCVPIERLLVGDGDLQQAILYMFNQLNLLFWLVELASPATLEAEGIPALQDFAGENHPPDFMNEEELKQAGSVADLACYIAMGDWSLQECNGLPVPWAPSDKKWDDERKTWIRKFAQLLLKVDGLDELDRRFKRDREWLTADKLKALVSNPNGLPKSKRALNALESHVFLRYYLASFQRGQFPVEILNMPRNLDPGETPACSSCANRSPTPEPSTPLMSQENETAQETASSEAESNAKKEELVQNEVMDEDVEEGELVEDEAMDQVSQEGGITGEGMEEMFEEGGWVDGMGSVEDDTLTVLDEDPPTLCEDGEYRPWRDMEFDGMEFDFPGEEMYYDYDYYDDDDDGDDGEGEYDYDYDDDAAYNLDT
ncbi:unnamed protein product [Peniophora sp. CBMAI 1063]|nr:unnamed protein product [Peniophora sp. CBMAI 1063]